MTPPPGLLTQEQFYEQDESRRGSHVLSYGSAWQQPGWTDANHVVELLWMGGSHELVAYYISYDWSRLAPGQLNRDVALAAAGEILADSGAYIGRELHDIDLATSEVDVEVIAKLDSDIACHELLWGWRWWQHHPDGLDHVRARARDQ